MVGFVLMGFVIGGLLGYFVGKWWAAIVAILLPLPLYLGIALDIWGNGFGENWQFTIALWVVPASVGFLAGAWAKPATNARGRPR